MNLGTVGRKLRSVILIAGGLVACGPAWADGVTFTGPTGGAGTSQNFVVNGVNITAAGYASDGTSATLFFKNGSSDETGLGLANGVAHEISGSAFIQLDLARLIVTNPAVLTLNIGSLDSQEKFSVWGSNTAGVRGTLLGNGGAGNGNFVLTDEMKKFRFISVTSPSGNVLLDGLQIGSTSVPEPGTLFLLIFGMIGVVTAGVLIRR